jgi:hypothetical protein
MSSFHGESIPLIDRELTASRLTAYGTTDTSGRSSAILHFGVGRRGESATDTMV